MAPTERERVVVDTTQAAWSPGDVEGHARLPLYTAADDRECVTIERLAAGTSLPAWVCHGGEEIYVVEGALADELGEYPSGTWIRNPDGYRRSLKSSGGATFWTKYGHLDAAR